MTTYTLIDLSAGDRDRVVGTRHAVDIESAISVLRHDLSDWIHIGHTYLVVAMNVRAVEGARIGNPTRLFKIETPKLPEPVAVRLHRL